MLNILLLVVIFVSLTCYYFVQCKSSMSIIEGKSPRKIKRRIRREKRRARRRLRRERRRARRRARRAAQRIAEAKKKAIEEAIKAEEAKRAAEEEAVQRVLEKNKIVQEKIHGQLKAGVSGTNISNCAVPYNTIFQLGKNKGLFNIFGNDEILRCSSDGNPEFVPAKQTEINNDGIAITNQNEDNTSGLIMYGDTISLCGKNYMIGGKDSTEKVQYGDNISITSNETGGKINATVNPNVYSLPNVKGLKSGDYTKYYVTEYEYCGNSGNGGGMSAQV